MVIVKSKRGQTVDRKFYMLIYYYNSIYYDDYPLFRFPHAPAKIAFKFNKLQTTLPLSSRE